MSHVTSTVPEIDNLFFLPFPAKPIAGIRITRVYATLVGVGPTGTIYTNRVSDKALYASDPRRFDEVWSCLVKLKVLSCAAIKKHKDDRACRERNRSYRYVAKSILTGAPSLGIKLTKAQKARLKKFVGED